MHVRVRSAGHPEVVVPLDSRLSKLETLRAALEKRLQIPKNRQRLFYGGKLLEDGYTLHDYNIKLNDVIQLMPRTTLESPKKHSKTDKNKNSIKNGTKEVIYEDDVSELYRVGDFVDVKNNHSAWFEAKIKQIVRNPDFVESNIHTNGRNKSPIKKSVSSPSNSPGTKGSKKNSKSSPENGIMSYFNKVDKTKEIKMNGHKSASSVGKYDENRMKEIIAEEEKRLIFRLLFDGEDEILNYKLSDIRPRARIELKIDDLQTNDTVMLNYNPEEPNEKGLWYDFTVHEVKKQRKHEELIGTLYHGSDVLVNDVKVKRHDKIFAIETVVPLSLRSDEYNKIMTTETPRRNRPLNCTSCRDKPNSKCKDCGCNICAGKDDPDKIILCDECNLGFHLACLYPPLEQIPDEDWYCTNCRRDTDDIIAPGKAKQQRKQNQSKTKKDWGRGMACVGKSQTCAMPANHFGPIPGVDVGMGWRFRIQLSESGVHRPPVSGIHGRDVDGAYSIVLSGGYEDDVDNGFEFTYTGSGGRDLSGNKRTADQSSDQTLTRENRALAKNCAVKDIDENGGDAKEKWRDGRPVRVVRSYKMLKHFPEYAPQEGIRYDGIYKVVKYYPERGKSGFNVWKYLLRRDDPNPAPWEKNAKQYPIVYPDGYLEAEAEKRAQKAILKLSNKKSVLKENNSITDTTKNDNASRKRKRNSNIEDSPPPKRTTRSSKSDTKPIVNTPKSKKIDKPTSQSPLINPFTLANSKKDSPKNEKSAQKENKDSGVLSSEEKDLISKDVSNKKTWDECVEPTKEGRQGLVNKISSLFLCIICQELVANPVTTSCTHNFCIGCLKQAFKSTSSHNCPYCRADLSKDELTCNDFLKNALQTIMPGYDNKRK